MQYLLIALAVAALAGCARVDSGVAAAGPPDTYTVIERDSPVNGGGSAAGQDVMAQAQSFCRARGAEPVTVGEQALGWPVEEQMLGPTGVQLTFRCRPLAPPAAAGIDAIPPP